MKMLSCTYLGVRTDECVRLWLLHPVQQLWHNRLYDICLDYPDVYML
jgi:hypothetical protein